MACGCNQVYGVMAWDPYPNKIKLGLDRYMLWRAYLSYKGTILSYKSANQQINQHDSFGSCWEVGMEQIWKIFK